MDQAARQICLTDIHRLMQSGQFVEAANVLSPVLSEAHYQGINDPDLLREAGLISVALKDLQGALVFLDAAVRAGDPDLNTLGMLADVSHHLKCPQVVVDHLARVAHPALGSRWARALATLFRLQEAETVIAQIPNADDDPIVGEVRTLISVGRYQKNRLQVAEQAAASYPTIPMIWGQLAAARQSFGDTDGACLAYRRALVLEPENPTWHYNYALSLLSAGDYVAGFKEYEWRMHSSVDRKLISHLPVNPGGLPLWRGERLYGKVLVLYAEGGIGDAILGLRFVPVLLQQQLATLRVLVPEGLLTLCQRIWPEVMFSAYLNDEIYAGADYWVSTLTVPDRIGLTAETVPLRDGYFSVCPDRLQSWSSKIRTACQAAGKQRSMALVWHGRVEHDYEQSRAYTAADFAKRVPSDCLPVIVQVDATPAERAEFGELGAYVWAGEGLSDFEETAAILAACDDGLLCDTSVAHLAGALALPMTVLIKNTFIWQWKCRADGQAIWYAQPRVVIESDGRSEEIVYARIEERRSSEEVCAHV